MGRVFDTSELGGLVKELAREIPRRNVRGQSAAVRQTSHEGALITRRIARGTARRWGKDYPPSIKSRRISALVYQWGPEGKAANWSFEEGSQNQPPHLDHEHGADQIEGRLPFRAQAAAEDAFVGW